MTNHDFRPRLRSLPGRGATAVEYALLALLVAAAIVTIVGVLGGNVCDLFDVSDNPLW